LRSDAFSASEITDPVVMPEPASQQTGGFSRAAALGGGLAGLAALAALGVLFLLKKGKKLPMPDEPDAMTETEASTIDDDDRGFVSEYGFSDGGHQMDGDGHGEGDEPVQPIQEEVLEEPNMASEHNPDERDDFNSHNQDELF
jgi:hypothetical protein